MIRKETPLKDILEITPACSCNQCNHGCKMGSGSLIDGDVKKIAKFLKISEKELKKKYLEKVILLNKEILKPKTIRKGKPYGKCIFFKNNKCSIHPVKPLECKVAMGCKPYGEDLMIWFMLNHVLDKDNPESIRQYASYLNSGGKCIPGGRLDEIVPNKKKLKRVLSREIK